VSALAKPQLAAGAGACSGGVLLRPFVTCSGCASISASVAAPAGMGDRIAQGLGDSSSILDTQHGHVSLMLAQPLDAWDFQSQCRRHCLLSSSGPLFLPTSLAVKLALKASIKG